MTTRMALASWTPNRVSLQATREVWREVLSSASSQAFGLDYASRSSVLAELARLQRELDADDDAVVVLAMSPDTARLIQRVGQERR